MSVEIDGGGGLDQDDDPGGVETLINFHSNYHHHHLTMPDDNDTMCGHPPGDDPKNTKKPCGHDADVPCPWFYDHALDCSVHFPGCCSVCDAYGQHIHMANTIEDRDFA